MNKPDFIPEADWNLVLQVCSKFNVDPYFIAAIGWHETHWGRLGAGKIGWILGYGYFPGSTVANRYRGLENQLNGACAQISKDMKLPITLENVSDFAVNSWKPGAPLSWASSVFNIYTSIKNGYVLPVTDTEIADLSKKVESINLVVEFIKEFFIKLGEELKGEHYKG